jgi:hypothetical protein
MVGWTRTAQPDFRFYEMITLSADGNEKSRIWRWYRKARLFQRTVINETRTARDWTQYEQPEYYTSRPKR